VNSTNWAHLKAFIWLRWRLAVNQTRRSGPGGAVVSGIVTVLMTAGGGVMLVLGFLVGFLALRTGPSKAVMAVWDGAIVGFVFFWLAGLMSELQRSDTLSLDRFLYLPVSPAGAFLINYLGSSVSLSLVLMLPAMTGLAAGLVLSRGPGMLLLFPLVAAFFLMMTAVTYQFRGWLASMMENPRRRRTIMTVVPLLFILMFQLPNIWINLGPGARERREAPRPPARAGNSDDGYATARMVNMIAPPGWLAYGAEAAADGRVWPAWAGIFGMMFIGAASLRRAYRTTLRLYRGDFNSGRRPPQSAIPVAPSGRTVAARRSTALMEYRLPWVSERVSCVTVTGFRSWMRASELKMTLFMPVMMIVVFTRMFVSRGATPELMRPLATSSLAALVLIFSMVGPIGNQFGYDRSGFLAFVLSPAPRRDMLMGKNLAVLPFALAMMVVMVALKPGSGMPAGHQGIRSFGPLLFMMVAPVLLGLTLGPLGIEALLSFMNWFARFPAYLVFGAAQTVIMVWLYCRVLDWEGDLLQRREPQILEIVSSRIE
jgi:hypothetical protein